MACVDMQKIAALARALYGEHWHQFRTICCPWSRRMLSAASA